MRFKLGFLTGFGAGYYLGSKAGRERYRQLSTMLNKAKESEAVAIASEKAKAAVDKAKGKADELRSGGGGSAPPVGDTDVDTDVDELRASPPLGGNGVTVPTPEI
jgi:hypothetical protein